jgi:hypothetical protein
LYPVLYDSKTEHVKSAAIWWRYAITCIRRTIREKQGIKGQFRISDTKLRIYRDQFMILYAKVLNNKVLTDIERLRYEKILYVFSIQQLKL